MASEIIYLLVGLFCLGVGATTRKRSINLSVLLIIWGFLYLLVFVGFLTQFGPFLSLFLVFFIAFKILALMGSRTVGTAGTIITYSFIFYMVMVMTRGI